MSGPSPVSAASYLGRAQVLRKSQDKASLFYAALELRCGTEARLQEHVAVAPGVTKSQARQWEIRKLARAIEESFGLGDSFLLVFVTMADGRSCRFTYAPVSARLQKIAERCGDYLHAIRPERVEAAGFWTEFRALVAEGCSLLDLACSSEILQPNVEAGFHFVLRDDDPRMPIVQDLIAGKPGEFTTATIEPVGPMTHYEN